MSEDAETVVRRFAAALDAADWPTASAALHDDCEYVCRGQTTRGPEAIVASYRTIHDWVQTTIGEDGLVSRIEHVDLPGEVDKAAAFNQACGVRRPG